MKALASPYVMCFEQSNPGFDILIISPHGMESKKTHLTFIEVRYSAFPSGTTESLATYKTKYGNVSKAVSSLLQGLSGREAPLMEIEWHFVFATFRETSIDANQVHDNTILLDKSGLRKFYGRSMASLGML